jgi:hypothetical protein
MSVEIEREQPVRTGRRIRKQTVPTIICPTEITAEQDEYTEIMSMQDKFYLLRDLMNRTNNDLTFLLRLLYGEKNELNAASEKYMSFITYLSQELCDVEIFCLAILRSWHRHPNNQRILNMHQHLVGRSPIEIEAPEDIVSGHHEGAFEYLKSKMEVILAGPLFSAARAKEHESAYIQALLYPQSAEAQAWAADQDQLTDLIEQVLAYVLCLFTVLGKNHQEQIKRKNKRNKKKYPKAGFKDCITGDAMIGDRSRSRHALPEGPVTEHEILFAIYNSVRNRAVDKFDGPIDPDTYERPKYGNTRMYNDWREKDEAKWQTYTPLQLEQMAESQKRLNEWVLAQQQAYGQGMR